MRFPTIFSQFASASSKYAETMWWQIKCPNRKQKKMMVKMVATAVWTENTLD